MSNLDWAKALHSKAVWTAFGSAVVAFLVALGMPLTAAQQSILEVALAGLFTTVFGSLLVAQAHVKAAATPSAATGQTVTSATKDTVPHA